MASRKFADLIAAVALVACGQLPAFAQGTEQQREACTPDAFRLCGQFIPDADRVEACLRGAGLGLSPACRAVFYPPASTSQSRSQPVRGRAPPQSDHDED
jgi:hypothetical protein